MTSSKNPELVNHNSAKKLKNLGLKALMILTILLTQSSCNSLPNKSTANIYQPLILRLKAKQQIQTSDGAYTPETDEVWHSDTRFRKLERQITMQ